MVAFGNSVWMYYLEKLSNGEYPLNRKRLSVKYGFKCAKQPLGSLYCGYYMCEHLRTCGQYIVNREDVNHHCFMYLYFVSPFFHCLLNSFMYPFTKDMQNGGVDNVISDICTLLCREIFHVDGTFFDKTRMLAEFSQLCNYKRFVV
jgi:hypothetical protein